MQRRLAPIYRVLAVAYAEICLKTVTGKKRMLQVAEPDIILTDVTLKRGPRTIMDGLSLTLSEQRIGLIGHNGSGKSTLARLINGLLLPDQGTVSTFGLATKEKRAELPAHVGFIFQNPDHQIIFPSVEEELAFSLEQTGLDRKKARKEARHWLAEVGREDWAERPVHELSEGQKQLVCIFAVLIMKPRLIILDEPFSSLDARTVRYLRALIASWPQQVIMISHDLTSFAGYDRIIWMEDGTVRMDGAPDAVLAAYQADILEGEAVL